MSPPTLRLSLQVIPVRRRLKHPFRSLLKKIRATLNIKTRNTSEPFKLPYLPSELWGVIIQHACLLYHDPLDTSQELSFLDSSSAQLATYRASMTLKKNLSLVSHEWNDYARRYLYEFVWISRAVQAKALARTLLLEYIDDTRSSGKYIRRLHIETSVLERCAPADLRTILEYAPHLNIYSDHRSVQRSLYDNMPDPRCSPEEILKLVIRPKIRRLSWTTYDDVPFQLRMTPLLQNLTIGLEYLELSSVSSSFRPSLSNSLSQAPDIDALQMSAQLPSLRALKLSLDNSTFAVLASWDMPALTNLSVLSSDFSYTGVGFSRFFQAHGTKLRQLELGHSSSLVEEHYLTMPQHILHMQQPPPVPLAEWCPNLREFICSADAEWHWQSPDWIAPHILLPAHPRIELIGIRDIDTRLREDPDVAGYSTPYFPLYEQLASLFRRDAFPALRFVRDLSTESHHMRTVRPPPRITQFWTQVAARSAAHGVWFEDCNGVNITPRALQRLSILQAQDDVDE